MDPLFEPYLREFCERNDIVVGAPAGVFFAGEHAVLGSGLACVQQLPRRVWVGLKLRPRKSLEQLQVELLRKPESHRIWLREHGLVNFCDVRARIEHTDWPKRTESITTLVKCLLVQPAIKALLPLDGLSFTVSILCELRSAAGCNFSGAFSTALVVALRLAAEYFGKAESVLQRSAKPSSSTLDEFKSLQWRDQLRDQKSILHRLNRAALVIELYMHDGNASGYGTLCSLVPTRWPVLYVREFPSTSEDGVPSKIAVEWTDLNKCGKLSESDWRVLTTKILDPDSGLRYRLLPFDEFPHWPAPQDYAFAFGLIYSGRPKDTSDAVTRVRALASELNSSGLAQMLEKQGADLWTWLRRQPRPRGLDALYAISQSTEDALQVLYGSLSPTAPTALYYLLRCFGVLTPPSIPNLTDPPAGLARAICGVQGGLDQLMLVDPRARWIAGQLVQAVGEEMAVAHGLKYTGGANGGYMLWVGPPDYSLETFVKEHLYSSPLVARDVNWERPSCDYLSVAEGPDSDGICFFLAPAPFHTRAQGKLLCYRASGMWWERAKGEPDSLEEWAWENKRLEAEHTPDWCLVDLGSRSSGAIEERPPILLGRTPLRFGEPPTRKALGRGVLPLAHALPLILEAGREGCSNSSITTHLRKVLPKKTGQSYFGSRLMFKTHIGRYLERSGAWKRIFGKISVEGVKDKHYTIRLPSRTQSSRVYIYLPVPSANDINGDQAR